MRNNFIKTTTCVAMILIFILQGAWLYNTYSILEKDLKEKLEEEYTKSIEKEVFYRMNSFDSPKQKAVPGAKVDNDSYTNALAFQEFLESEGYPFSLSRLDSIWTQALINTVGFADYSICLIDTAGTILEKGEYKKDRIKRGISITKPIRMDGSQLLQTVVASPNRIIFERMALLLITSMLIAVVIGYCIYLQIKIILRQDRIAEIRRDFTHAMVHEMKNPITTISMGINTLKSGKLDDRAELKRQYFDIVSDESDQLMALTNRILTIAKFEEKKIELEKEEIYLKPLFEQLIEKYRLKAVKEFSVEVVYNGVETIYGDKDYLYEVFGNLIDNAVKYAKDKIRIEITCSTDNQHATIAVKDYGIGISLKDQRKIFDKFERGLSVIKEDKVKGFGLGLNYVYQVVTSHDGTILINSVIDLYSEFIITLPNRR